MTAKSTEQAFLDINRIYFEKSDTERYRWQTRHPYVSCEEKRLLEDIFKNIPSSKKIIEVGCGEGANLTLQYTPDKTWFGVDYALEKVRFAKICHSRCQWIAGDVHALPFVKDAFDVVYCRDLLHHVSHPKAALDNMVRICKPGGFVVVLESNGLNPLFALFGLIRKAERGVLNNRPGRLRKIFSSIKQLENNRIMMTQPSVLHRVIFHHRSLFCRLANFKIIRNIVKASEVFLGWITPRKFWGYILLVAQKQE